MNYKYKGKSVRERVEEMVSIIPITGCWMWMGVIGTTGYGWLKLGGIKYQAHRKSYEVFRGPIASDLCLDHLCRHRWCVNPDHLEQVTNRENIRRAYATKTRCLRGHEYDERSQNSRGHRQCRACERERGVARWQAELATREALGKTTPMRCTRGRKAQYSAVAFAIKQAKAAEAV